MLIQMISKLNMTYTENVPNNHQGYIVLLKDGLLRRRVCDLSIRGYLLPSGGQNEETSGLLEGIEIMTWCPIVMHMIVTLRVTSG